MQNKSLKDSKERVVTLAEFLSMLEVNHSFAKKILLEFKKVYDNEEIKEKFPKIKLVYTELIVVYINKIISDLRHDYYSIGKLKFLLKEKEDVVVIIKKIELENKEIINKIRDNRSRVVAHGDYEVHTYSKKEKERRIKAHQDTLRNSGKDVLSHEECSRGLFLKSEDTTFELYTPDDLNDDLEKITKLLDDVDLVRREAQRHII